MIRVLLADDLAMVRQGFGALLAAQPDLVVVGDAPDGAAAVTATRRLNPDVVLMDVRMPVMDGLEATRRLLTPGASVRVLILTTFDLDDYVYEALRAGASGFLLKDAPAADLVHAVRVVAAGEALLSPAATRGLVSRFLSQPVPSALPAALELGGLTDREREVLALVAYGLSNDEIAERLHLSPLTVKTHINRAMSKLGVRDRAQLVVIAYQSGLVRPGEQP